LRAAFPQEPGDGDQCRLGASVVFDASEQARLSGPAPNRLGSGSVLGPVTPGRDTYGALPSRWRQEGHRNAASAKDALDDATGASESKRADCALAGPRADIFDEGLCRMRAKNKFSEQWSIDGGAPFGAIVKARHIDDLDYLACHGVDNHDGAMRAYVYSENWRHCATSPKCKSATAAAIASDKWNLRASHAARRS
jgi:hypothetical protein